METFWYAAYVPAVSRSRNEVERTDAAALLYVSTKESK